MASRGDGGDNGSVHLTVDDIEEILASGAGRPAEPGASHTHLDHALQTAALLGTDVRAAVRSPDRRRQLSDEVVVAGLVHDIGHLLPGVGDAAHAEAGAACVRRVLGEPVAGLVGLHVAAKRYLVADEGVYGGGLSADSVASLAVQGGPMSTDERAKFERLSLFAESVALRRADDRGKVDGLLVEGLPVWMEVVRRVARHEGSA